MADALLGGLERPACLYCLPAVFQDVLEELSIFAPQLVALFAGYPLGERCLAPQPLLHIPAAPLDDVRQQVLPFGLGLERRVEQPQQRPETLLDPAVRGCGHQDEMTCRVFRKIAQEFVSLMFNSRRAAGAGGNVRLVDDDQVGRIAQEGRAMALRLQEIDAADEVGVVGEDGDILSRHVALKSGDLRRLHEDAVDRELLAKLALPLIAEMRGSENAKSPCDSAIEQLARDHPRLDRLADADVVRDQQPHRIKPQGHDERHELVGPRCYRDPTQRSERRRAGSKIEASCVEKSHHAGRIAGVLGSRRCKFG